MGDVGGAREAASCAVLLLATRAAASGGGAHRPPRARGRLRLERRCYDGERRRSGGAASRRTSGSACAITLWDLRAAYGGDLLTTDRVAPEGCEPARRRSTLAVAVRAAHDASTSAFRGAVAPDPDRASRGSASSARAATPRRSSSATRASPGADAARRRSPRRCASAAALFEDGTGGAHARAGRRGAPAARPAARACGGAYRSHALPVLEPGGGRALRPHALQARGALAVVAPPRRSTPRQARRSGRAGRARRSCPRRAVELAGASRAWDFRVEARHGLGLAPRLARASCGLLRVRCLALRLGAASGCAATAGSGAAGRAPDGATR